MPTRSFAKKEERLNLCVPGGKDTARMLKKLYAELGAAPAAAPAERRRRRRVVAAPGRSRDNPAIATFLSRRRLNKEGSDKETWHVEFDLAESGLDYVVGDSFGIYPANDPALVDAVIAALDAPPDFPIGGRTLREVLTDGVSLSPAPDMLFQLISYLTGGERRQKAKALADGEDPDGDAATLDVLAALAEIPRHPARSGSLHRGARSVAAARLFDLVLAQGAIPAASRSRSTRCATRSTSARGSASPRPSSPAASSPATRSGSMCRRRSTSRCRPIRASRSS